MKMNVKIILPLLIISALLILLAGCMTTPSDESPGVTPGTGTIMGTIAAPCCILSDELVTETPCVSSEYWCCFCQANWFEQDGIEVVLTYGENEVATTTTNSDGEYTFTDVPPGSNYVVTAYCPDYSDNRPLVKDVALEVASTFDTKITDLVSTSLGLVVDFLVYYTEWGPEDISLDDVIADQSLFINFPKFKALIYEVRLELENCELNNLLTDEVLYATCRAAEEISGLDIGCDTGFTPGPTPTPTPGECDGNLLPTITDVKQDDTSIYNETEIHLVVGTPYEFCVTAADNDNILPQDLIYYLTIDGSAYYGTGNCITITPEAEDVGTHTAYVNVYDGCDPTPWGPIKIVVDCCPFDESGLTIEIEKLVANEMGIEMSRDRALDPLCMDDSAIVSSITVNYGGLNPLPPLVITPSYIGKGLTWDPDPGISFDPTTGVVYLIGGAATGTPGTYKIDLTYTDLCQVTSSGSVNITFEDCSCPPLEDLSIAVVPACGTVCDDACATLGPVTVSFSDSTSDLSIAMGDDSLTWEATPSGITFDDSTGEVCLDGGDVKTYTLGVTYKDKCEEEVYGTVDVTFELCCPPLEDLSIAVVPACGTVCDDACATLGPVTVSFSDSTSDLSIAMGDDSLTWEATPSGITFDDSTGEVCLDGGDVKTYTLGVTYKDKCEEEVYGTVDVTFEQCCDAPCCLPMKTDFKTHNMGSLTDTSDTYWPNVELKDIISGYNIWTGTGWDGWCVDSGFGINHDHWYDDKAVECSISFTSDLPVWYDNINWSKINWIINNRESTHTMEDVQDAIWHFTNGLNSGLSSNSTSLINGANAHDTFIPDVGDKYAVILDANIGRCIQRIIIEAVVTCYCPPAQ